MRVRCRRLRTVKEIKGLLLDCGALGAIMTGTGSAVFGIFRKDADCAPATAMADSASVVNNDMLLFMGVHLFL